MYGYEAQVLPLEIISIHLNVFIVQFTFPTLAGSLKTILPPITTDFMNINNLRVEKMQT